MNVKRLFLIKAQASLTDIFKRVCMFHDFKEGGRDGKFRIAYDEHRCVGILVVISVQSSYTFYKAIDEFTVVVFF